MQQPTAKARSTTRTSSALEDPELLRAVLAKVVPEGIQDNLVPITLDTQYHQAVAVTSQQRALNMSSYASQVIQPAVDIIANMRRRVE